jgi:hypothetical protein
MRLNAQEITLMHSMTLKMFVWNTFLVAKKATFQYNLLIKYYSNRTKTCS